MLKFEPRQYKEIKSKCADFEKENYPTCLTTIGGEPVDFYGCKKQSNCKNYCGDKCQTNIVEIK